MRKLWHWFYIEGHKHRFCQSCVTIGVIGSTAIAYFLPHHGELAIVAGVATNMLWIWER